MVKFGERLIAMQHAGWEAHYIRYNELKLLIDNIKASTSEATSEAASQYAGSEAHTHNTQLAPRPTCEYLAGGARNQTTHQSTHACVPPAGAGASSPRSCK